MGLQLLPLLFGLLFEALILTSPPESPTYEIESQASAITSELIVAEHRIELGSGAMQ